MSSSDIIKFITCSSTASMSLFNAVCSSSNVNKSAFRLSSYRPASPSFSSIFASFSPNFSSCFSSFSIFLRMGAVSLRCSADFLRCSSLDNALGTLDVSRETSVLWSANFLSSSFLLSLACLACCLQVCDNH